MKQLLCLLFLISYILPQLELSSPNLRHRHYFPHHLLNHHLLLLLDQHPGKEKTEEEKMLGTTFSQGVEKSEEPSALQPTTGIICFLNTYSLSLLVLEVCSVTSLCKFLWRRRHPREFLAILWEPFGQYSMEQLAWHLKTISHMIYMTERK